MTRAEREAELNGRVVLITGAAAGIGWAAARRFAAQGARVLIADIDADKAAGRASALGAAHASFAVDMAQPEQVAEMVRTCVSRLGGLDVLVNNAGRTDTDGLGVVDQPVSTFENLVAVNLRGSLVAAEQAAAVMRRSRGGAIVNIASGAALRPVPFRNGYSASKAGVLAMTRHHACAWARDGIRVNAVAPGYTRTELVEALIARGRIDPVAVARRIPLGRMAAPEEIAAAITFLASPRVSSITGSTFLVDGGSLLGGPGPAGETNSRAAPPGRQTYVVIGALNSLGWAMTRTFVADDVTVVALDADGRQLAALAAEVSGCHALPVDISDEPAMAEAIAGISRRFGRIDGVVNAIGADAVITGNPADLGGDALAVHLTGALCVAKAVGPILQQQGFGTLLNLTSIGGDVAFGDHVEAAASAGAVAMLTRTLACEWSGHGIRVNAIAAGPIEGAASSAVRRLPVGRAISAQDIAETAAFLLSPDAGYVTGSVIAVDGGLSVYAGPDRAVAGYPA
ncbi:SDR family oxidoreductase [Bradyrhizobium manausense]|uniref:SDR family oxidoreductase n=1 Tax=Bradyrhizobium TaxID=374 RepID=UPI001BA69A5B|nr:MULTISPECIES: SDR family oxidoreductase [Bradyrhizobium]MBR0825120.1 SDR family oxidoreductase [Bradyrhizobium manausense]UVO32436.1 SDR family oxidoreductase [Bradyrhizobium arachidis]